MASFALVSKYGIPPLDWQKVMARFDEICAIVSFMFKQAHKENPYHSFALLNINLVADYDLLESAWATPWSHERKAHTNGKLSGSIGLACTRNSSLQLSNVSKLFELLTSYTSTQQSAPR
jgi:hypothetical protein